jgi:hypothetical protein
MGTDKRLVDEKKNACMKHWECRDTGNVTEFLGMHVKRNAATLELDQQLYLKKVLERFKVINAKTAPTPLPSGCSLETYTGPIDKDRRHIFQQIVGSVLYLMLGTRPDIAYAVIRLSQFSANPSQDHLNYATYLLRYLVETQDTKLVYDAKKGEGLQAFTDSDWAADKNSRRSTTGYFATLATGSVCWQSRLQKTVALSSTEAEYMALSDTCRQIVWIQSLFTELGFPLRRTPICADNQGSIFIGSNPVQERRTKHIDIRYHYVRECVEEGKVSVFFIEGTVNPADMLTKPLAREKFEGFREQLGLVFARKVQKTSTSVPRVHLLRKAAH